MKIISVKDIPLTIAVGIMRRYVDRSSISELQQRFLEYGESVIKCSPDTSEELFEELIKLGLKEVTASQIIDIAPSDINTLKILFVFEERTPSDETLEKILDMVRNYCGSERG